MISFTLKLAGIPIGVQVSYPETKLLCADYLTDEEALFEVCVSADVLNRERLRARKERARLGKQPFEYSNEYLESLALYREIAEGIADCGAFVLHASVAEVDGCAFAFTGPSGTGKSTHAQMWCQVLGSAATILNDDKPIVRVMKDSKDSCRVLAYGTPWDGKHHLSENRHAPLAGIAVLRQADTNSINRLSLDQALDLLVRQVYRPYRSQGVVQTLLCVEQMVREVPVYSLACTATPKAARIAYQTMAGLANTNKLL